MLSANPHIINVKENARKALLQLDTLPDNETRTLFVVEEDHKLAGSLTDGDIRRGLLAGREISENVSFYMNKECKFLNEETLTNTVLKQYRSLDIKLIPFLDEKGAIIKLIDLKTLKTIIPASVLIMAGGRGERLKPLTDTIPKPLLKIGKKPIIEHNLDRLIQYGVEEFYISVNYLSEQIVSHLQDGSAKGVKIHYVYEDEPLGTIGALGLVKEFTNENVIVMNADVLTNIDFEDFYSYFLLQGCEMCAASVPYKIQIPYGVFELAKNGNTVINSLKEKPTYTYYSNAGIYFLKKSLKQYIPKNTLFNATDLIEKLIEQGKMVAHYPILNYWLDIGKQEDFLKAQIDIKHIQL